MAGFKPLFYISAGFLMSVVFLIFAITVASDLTKKAEIPEDAMAFIFTKVFENSDKCFAVVDITSGIISARTIDWIKFTSQNLQFCYDEKGKKTPAFQLVLKGALGEKTVNTKQWNSNGGFESLGVDRMKIAHEGSIQTGELRINIQR